MLHKVSELCNRIDVIKQKSDRLRTAKYEDPKAPDYEIDNLIQDIQSMCRLIAADRTPYSKSEQTVQQSDE